MGANDVMVYGEYHSSNGNTYMVKLTQADATAGGFATNTNPLAYPAWPYNTNDLRHVTSYDTSSLAPGRLKIATENNALYTSGGTYTNSNTGRTYQVQGCFGERRPLNHLGGG